MPKYRIAIQRIAYSNVADKYRNVTIISDDDIDTVQEKLQYAFSEEFDTWLRDFTSRLREAEKKKFIEEVVASDNFDNHAVGNDITDEEFIDNERFFAVYE